MKKTAVLINVAMLAAALSLTAPAFADKTSNAKQSTKQTPVSKNPSAISPKGGKEPVAHTTTITNATLSPTKQYGPKKPPANSTKGGKEPIAPTTTTTSSVPPAK
jgi:hypothetical protein